MSEELPGGFVRNLLGEVEGLEVAKSESYMTLSLVALLLKTGLTSGISRGA